MLVKQSVLFFIILSLNFIYIAYYVDHYATPLPILSLFLVDGQPLSSGEECHPIIFHPSPLTIPSYNSLCFVSYLSYFAHLNSSCAN